MEIQCDCGSLRASLTGLPRTPPGRFFCMLFTFMDSNWICY